MQTFINAISNLDVNRVSRDPNVVAGMDELRIGGLLRLRVYTALALESLRYLIGAKHAMPAFQGATHAQAPSCALHGSSGCWRPERPTKSLAFAALR